MPPTADSDPHVEPGSGVLRRRSMPIDAGESSEHVSDDASRTNEPRHQRSRSSGVDISPVGGQAPPPLDTTGRTVRFSADVDRDIISSTTHHSAGGTTPANGPRTGLSGLAIDSNRSNMLGSTTSGPHQSPTSPTSPNSRARGYSLRTSLFKKKLAETNTIELVENTSPSDPDHGEESSKPKKNTFTSTNSALPNYQSWVQSRPQTSAFRRKIKDITKFLQRVILRIEDIPPSVDGRHIVLDASRKDALIDERTNKIYTENWIRSTRYTAYTFLPRQLVAQFSKLANFYFLCVAILQMIPKLSTTGMYTTIAPLSFFVTISMGKEGFDDYRRHRLDKEENARDATVLHAYVAPEEEETPRQNDVAVSLGPLHWAKVKWKSLRVGDIIRLKRDEAVPADIVLLHAKGEHHIAYIETMALDGETNLKSKITTSSLARACATESKLAECRAHFVVEDPNPNLYSFDGKVTVDNHTSPLTNNEIIYRGSVLRNTTEAIGMVIYTGEECKIRMNANKNPRTKAPHLQFVLNRIVMIVVAFVISLALFNTIAYQFWRASTERKSWYISTAAVPFYQILAGFFIMFSTMIPLSLYVSMEIIKLAQMFLLNDIDMYDEKSNTPLEARTSTINEELGQVTHIFSDKTGTLTDNVMKFRKLSIAGTVWLHDKDLQGQKKEMLRHKRRNKGKRPARRISLADRRKSSSSFTAPDRDIESADGPRPSVEPRWQSSARPAKAQPERSTMELINYLQKRPETVFATKARILLLSMALCHTCLPESKADGSIDFQASSPDELALVRAAQDLGYLVYSREHGTLTLRLHVSNDANVEPITEVYEILDVVEFSSTRKRMTVVVRFPNGKICVICKGADSIVMSRLKLASLASRKVAEIEKRADHRKSMEAQVALARRSTQIDRSKSVKRTSFAIDAPRRSMSGASKTQTREEVDSWLRSRERDIELVGEVIDTTPIRRSTQMQRISMAASEARSSIIEEEFEEFPDDILVSDDGDVIERCFQHINDFATEGLRTLLYAYRFIDEAEYSGWKEIYHAATTSLVEREDKIEKAGELIEVDFDLAGATAIEDKLQYGVPESMDKLRRANIKIWMLTGDKRETAINIGHSCRLIKDYSTVIVLDKELEEVEQHIASATLTLQNEKIAHSVVVIDGHTLSWINEAAHTQHLFYDLAILADSVICCRAQPSQKAQLVHGIRKRIKKSITLAIGDGANDIAMIQEAHVGIGITGKEGLQAARTSDYSIAQFRFLNKLLLVHGRWNYIRTCKYILGTLWKELVFFLTQALYQRWAGYTGTSLYEPWSLATFNTLFTSLPVLVMGIFEKDLAASTLLAVPELYTKGQNNGAFNLWIYLGWMAMGAAESVIIYFSMLCLYAFTQGANNSLFAMGDLDFIACVAIIAMKMQLVEMHNKSITAWIALVLSIGAVFLWNLLLAALYPYNPIYHVRHEWFKSFGKNPRWWLVLLFIVLAVAVLEFSVTSLRAALFPTDVDVFQELEKDPDVKKRFEEASAMELQQGWLKEKK
jgi:phospholipid-translocating ATPase